MTPPQDVDEAAAQTCAGLTAALPTQIAAGRQWPVEPPSDLVAAWGAPPVVLRCGVPPPSGLQPTSPLVAVDQVTWFVESLTAGTRFTTVAREVRVEVSVPEQYQPAADVIAELSGTIADNVPARR